MGNKIRQGVATELKDPHLIIRANAQGWAAVRVALVSTEREIRAGQTVSPELAERAIQAAQAAGAASATDPRESRFTGFKDIMAWQDALFVVNAMDGWHFSDEVLLVGWLVELGGPEMGRGPARASYWKQTSSHYIGGTRDLYNRGMHGNGPDWPVSLEYSGKRIR